MTAIVIQYQARSLPLSPPATFPAGWQSLVSGFLARHLSAAGQQFYAGPVQAPAAVTAPFGYDAIPPAASIGRRSPAPETVIVQPAVINYLAWIIMPDVRVPKPVSASAVDLPVQQVPTQFVGNAWGFMWDGPPRKRFPAPAQQDRDLPVQQVPTAFVGNGWVTAIDKRAPIIRPTPVFADFAAQQVPTVFMANGWTALWDGPQHKRFAPELQRADQPVLATYSSVIITYPDGWQAIFPALPQQSRPGRSVEIVAQQIIAITPQGWSISAEPRYVEHLPGGGSVDVTNPPTRPVWGWEARVDAQPRRSRPAEATATFIVPALIFRAWGFAEQVQPRAKVDGSIVTLVSPIIVTPQGFGVTFPEPIRARFLQRPAEITSFPATAAMPSGFSVVDGLPPRKLKSPASEPLNAVGRFPGTPIGVTALWGFADWHFRVIRPAPPDFGRMWPKIGFRIASQPTLLGTDQQPTMDGTDAQASLTGTKSKPDLEGDV